MLRSGRKPQAIAPDAGRTSPATGIPPVFFHKGFDMKRFLIVLAIAGAALLSACAASRKDFYDAQNDYREQIAARDAAKAAVLQTAAAGCADDSCRITIAGFAALARGESVAAPQQYRSEGSAILGMVDRAIGVGSSIHSARMNRDTLVGIAGVVADSAGDRSTHSFIDQSDHSDHSTSIADSFNSEAGDTISDSGNVSDSGNGNAGRDLIGGNRTDNAGNIGTDNRIDSPGPIDSSNPGDCDGESNCNPTTEQPEG